MNANARVTRVHWTRTGVGLAVGAALVLFFVLPRLRDDDLRSALAKAWNVKPQHLYLNLPPKPQRYPGALFDSLYAVPIHFAQSLDGDMVRGESMRFEHRTKETGKAEGAVGAGVFGALMRRSADLDRSVEIPDLRLVEMTWPLIARRVQAMGWNGVPGDVLVVIRAYEGRLTYRFKRRDSFALAEWAQFKRHVLSEAAGDSAITLRFEGEANSENVGVMTTVAPIVIAYEACPAGLATKWLPGTPAPPPVTARLPLEDMEGAVERLLRFDPARVTVLDQAVREIGPPVELHAVLDSIAIEPQISELKRQRASWVLVGARNVLDGH